jgi:multicomponent Na+:H+ antiporter subunit C
LNVLFAITTGILFGIGVFQVLRRDLIKSAMGFYILFTAINLFILASGAFQAEVPAYTDQVDDGQAADPLVQALILTAVVISFGSYALLLGLVNLTSRRFKTIDLDEVNQLKG